MNENELLIISEHVSRMPEGERVIFYQLKKKSKSIGLVLVVLLFGGGGQIYATEALKGVLSIFFILLTLLLSYLVWDANGWGLLTWFGCLIIIALYMYALWDTSRMVDEYNENLYLAVFGSFKK